MFRLEIGEGDTIVVVHGGPDFDHHYLRPEMDGLADSFRLVYYDQRGRGRSAEGARAEAVSIDSEIADLDALREELGEESIALLGHSWGGLVAMEYAVRHPNRVSHLILMNTAPGSCAGRVAFVEHLAKLRSPEDARALARLQETDGFQRGDLATETEYLRLHFQADGSPRYQIDRLVDRLRKHFTPETVLMARAIEKRLYEQTWLRGDYDLLPSLAAHGPRTLVIHGDRDFIPVEIAHQIAATVPGAELAILHDCGHFAFINHRDEVIDLIASFLTDDSVA